MTIDDYLAQNFWWLILALVWGLMWKGWALWISARKNQSVWFIVFMIVNTLGILEIFYIFYFSKQAAAKANPKK